MNEMIPSPMLTDSLQGCVTDIGALTAGTIVVMACEKAVLCKLGYCIYVHIVISCTLRFCKYCFIQTEKKITFMG